LECGDCGTFEGIISEFPWRKLRK